MQTQEVVLEPVRTRLVFAARLSHGPGFDEMLEFRVGRSACGHFDVLWQKADWVVEERQLNAVAWLPRNTLKGKRLSLALLKAVLEAEKQRYNAAAPNFSEVVGGRKSLLDANEVWSVVDQVFDGS